MHNRCSLLLQILILDEADRVLDSAFKGQLDPIISQLPKHRQTLLFSATQTKKVKDLARLSLRDPEYISVHEEALTATPASLMQTVMIVPVEKKLDMLWSFIKTHLNSRILVFLSTKKQVRLFYLSSSLNNQRGDSLFHFYSATFFYLEIDKRITILGRSNLFMKHSTSSGLEYL